MSGNWVQDCKTILDEIKKLEDVKGRDRLDMVRVIRFTLHALQRSVSGWLQWADNPDIMANFSLEELREINKNLGKLTRSFVEYDAEITSITEKDLTAKEKKARRELMERTKDKTEIFYVK
jgi:hypothetical protein